MKQFRINQTKGLEFGLYSLGDHIPNPLTGKRISSQKRIQELIEMAKLAEAAGIDVFGVGESHQQYFTTQAHTVILGAIAQATNKIKLISTATLLSVADPVRIYEDFATIDLISNGRAEIIAGRGSRAGAFQLFGVKLENYEEIYEEKLALLKKINEEKQITWRGNFRAALENTEILPRPSNGFLPIWRGVGGRSPSAVKAGMMGIPMVLTTLGGPAVNFKKYIDVYRQTLVENGYNSKDFPVATTCLFYVVKTEKEAFEGMYPHLSGGFEAIRGTSYPKQQFRQASDSKDALMVGDVNKIIDKLLYQYELFHMQRFMAHIDFGGVPFDKIMKMIELIGKEIVPVIKKYTRN